MKKKNVKQEVIQKAEATYNNAVQKIEALCYFETQKSADPERIAFIEKYRQEKLKVVRNMYDAFLYRLEEIDNLTTLDIRQIQKLAEPITY
jgi:hypothetical protein